MPTRVRKESIPANQLTKWALVVLTTKGCKVWRQNNLAAPGRKFIGMRGLPDVVGYDAEGHAVYCEVKAVGDKLSDAQIAFMSDASKAGCKTFIAYEHNGAMMLKQWADYVMTVLYPVSHESRTGD